MVVMDISLPEISGMKIAEKLRKSGYKGHIIAFATLGHYMEMIQTAQDIL